MPANIPPLDGGVYTGVYIGLLMSNVPGLYPGPGLISGITLYGENPACGGGVLGVCAPA